MYLMFSMAANLIQIILLHYAKSIIKMCMMEKLILLFFN